MHKLTRARSACALFARAHASLRDGGRLLLEPQPWSSYTNYRTRAALTPTIRQHYAQIALRPEHFERHLLDVVGFRSCERVEVAYGDGTSSGFARRPLWLLTK